MRVIATKRDSLRHRTSFFSHLASNIRCGAIALLIAAPVLGGQRADTSLRVRLNGFVDAYYAYDFNRPGDLERAFTTQAVRHNEVNVNLAWLGVTVERARTRARLALQAGTSVQTNYAAEPRNGSTSGPELSRMLQEAVVGYRLRDKLWIDAGIYYSYIGLESWSSSDNLTYTRSLVADYSPYYLSGARLTWQPSKKVTAQVHVTNGWQNISESNDSKGVGGRIDIALTPSLIVSYANYVGNERLAPAAAETRIFNQVMAKGTFSSGTHWQAQGDVGQQGARDWYGAVAIVRHPFTQRVAVNGRLERYADRDGVIIDTGRLTPGFVGNGGSIGLDVTLDAGTLWRTEFRRVETDAALFVRRVPPSLTRSNSVLVTSMSFGF